MKKAKKKCRICKKKPVEKNREECTGCLDKIAKDFHDSWDDMETPSEAAFGRRANQLQSLTQWGI